MNVKPHPHIDTTYNNYIIYTIYVRLGFTQRPEEVKLHSPMPVSSSSGTAVPVYYSTDPNHTDNNNQSMLSKSIHTAMSSNEGKMLQ